MVIAIIKINDLQLYQHKIKMAMNNNLNNLQNEESKMMIKLLFGPILAINWT